MALAEEMAKLFVEAIAAPSFSEGARAKLSTRKNLRLLVVKHAAPGKVVKQISGGLLLQDADIEDVAAVRVQGGDGCANLRRKKWRRFFLPGGWLSTSSPMP